MGGGRRPRNEYAGEFKVKRPGPQALCINPPAGPGLGYKDSNTQGAFDWTAAHRLTGQSLVFRHLPLGGEGIAQPEWRAHSGFS